MNCRRRPRPARRMLHPSAARAVTAEHQPTPSHGARRRGRARATPPARRARPRAGARPRPWAGGPAPADARHSHGRGGASDQSVIHMRRPGQSAKRLNVRGAPPSYAPSLRFPPARRLPGAQCGLLRRSPHQEGRRVQAARRQGESYVSPDYRMLRLRRPTGTATARSHRRRPSRKDGHAGVPCCAPRRTAALVRSEGARPGRGARGAHPPWRPCTTRDRARASTAQVESPHRPGHPSPLRPAVNRGASALTAAGDRRKDVHR